MTHRGGLDEDIKFGDLSCQKFRSAMKVKLTVLFLKNKCVSWWKNNCQDEWPNLSPVQPKNDIYIY